MKNSNFKNLMYDNSTKNNRNKYSEVYNVVCKNYTQASVLISQLQLEGFELIYYSEEVKNVLVNFKLKRIASFDDYKKSTRKEVKLSLEEFVPILEAELNKLKAGL